MNIFSIFISISILSTSSIDSGFDSWGNGKKLDFLCVFKVHDWSVVSFLEKNKGKLHITSLLVSRWNLMDLKWKSIFLISSIVIIIFCGETYQVEFKYFKDSKEQEEHEWRGEGKRSLFVEKQIWTIFFQIFIDSLL